MNPSSIPALASIAVYEYLIPGLFVVIFITFLWGSFHYWLAGVADEEVREKGKAVIMYAFLTFLGLVLFYVLCKFIERLFS